MTLKEMAKEEQSSPCVNGSQVRKGSSQEPMVPAVIPTTSGMLGTLELTASFSTCAVAQPSIAGPEGSVVTIGNWCT